jgi:hypothetical protein
VTVIYNIINIVTSLNPSITVLSSTEKTYSNNEIGAIELSKDANSILEKNSLTFATAILNALEATDSQRQSVLGPIADRFMALANQFAGEAQRYQNNLNYNLPAAYDAYLTAAGFILSGGLHIAAGGLAIAGGALLASSHIVSAALYLVQVVRALLNGPDWENAINNANAAVNECENANADITAGEQNCMRQTALAAQDIRASTNPALEGVTLTTYLAIDVVLFPTFTALFLACVVAAMACALVEGDEVPLIIPGINLDNIIVGKGTN